MTIKKTLIIGFSIIFILTGITFVLLLMQNKTQEDLQDYSLIRYQSYLAADELRQSSDDLTRLARLYVVSKVSEPKQATEYLREYFAILDIRNGSVARPEHYNRIFWDFAAVTGSNPTPNSNITKSLNDIMIDLNFTQEELQLLDEANANSDGLVNTEVMAMNLVDGNIGSDEKSAMKIGESAQDTAIRIMHDKEYMVNKAGIMAPINEFYALFDKRTENLVLDAQKKVNQLATIAIITMVALIIVGLVIAITIFRTTITNIEILKSKLDDLVSSGGDLTQRIVINGKNEMGDLASSINQFIINLGEIMHDIIEQSKNADNNLLELASIISTVNDDVSDVSATTEEISASMQETAATSEELNATAIELERVTQSIAERADEGATASRNIHDRAVTLSSEFEQSIEQANDIFVGVKSKLEGALDQAKTVHQINELSNTILQITSQTNLLALNAAIEAARAGEAGRGFAVVADEIRNLAEDSKDAVEKIQSVTVIVTESVENLTGNANELLTFVSDQVMTDYNSMLSGTKGYQEDATYLDEMITGFSDTSKDLLVSITEIIQSIEEVTTATNEGAKGTINIAEKTTSIHSETIEVIEKSRSVKSSLEEVNKMISKFTV